MFGNFESLFEGWRAEQRLGLELMDGVPGAGVVEERGWNGTGIHEGRIGKNVFFESAETASHRKRAQPARIEFLPVLKESQAGPTRGAKLL
jgi:hypothetical protein